MFSVAVAEQNWKAHHYLTGFGSIQPLWEEKKVFCSYVIQTITKRPCHNRCMVLNLLPWVVVCPTQDHFFKDDPEKDLNV